MVIFKIIIQVYNPNLETIRKNKNFRGLLREGKCKYMAVVIGIQ